MPIDLELRSKGIGASEVASVIGMSPYADAFSVWADKLGLVERPEPDIRQRKGKFFESGIAAWYSEETGNPVEWFDSTVQHPTRTFMVCTPDAWVLDPTRTERIGGVDSKLVGFQNYDQWGDPGTDKVPDHYAIQCQWTCSTTEKPFWDLAACLGDELRVYRIHRDPQIEAVLLETIEKFWKDNVLGRTQPPIGATDTAKAYLKQRFPKHVEPLRVATPEEVELLTRYKGLREQWDILEPEYDAVEMQIRECIGDAEGIIAGPVKVTYRKDKDSTGTDWKAIAEDMALRLDTIRSAAGKGEDGWNDVEIFNAIRVSMDGLPKTMAEIEAKHQTITRHGPRKLRPTFGKKGK